MSIILYVGCHAQVTSLNKFSLLTDRNYYLTSVFATCALFANKTGKNVQYSEKENENSTSAEIIERASKTVQRFFHKISMKTHKTC